MVSNDSAVFVERPRHRVDRGVLHPRDGRQVHGGGVSRMQPDDGLRDRRDIIRSGRVRQAMSLGKPTPPFTDLDRASRRHTAIVAWRFAQSSCASTLPAGTLRSMRAEIVSIVVVLM